MSQSVPDMQEALVTLLSAALQSEGVIVLPELPREVPREAERVYVIDETGYTLGGGEQFREESFGLRFVVEVYKSGDDAPATKRRKWELIEAIDEALEADDFAGYKSYGMTLSVTSETVAHPDGWITRSTCAIGAHGEV